MKRTLLTAEEAHTLVPHGADFTFVDEIFEFDGVWWATWQVPTEHPLLALHFPGTGVVPGVILLEAMAQAAGLISLCQQTERGALRRGETFVVTDFHDVHLRGIVRMGDRLSLETCRYEARGPTTEIGFRGKTSSSNRPVIRGCVRVALVGVDRLLPRSTS